MSGNNKNKIFEKEGLKTPIWAMSAERTAKIAVDGLMRGRGVIVPGIPKRIKYYSTLSGIIPYLLHFQNVL